jgi:hypothetical protein
MRTYVLNKTIIYMCYIKPLYICSVPGGPFECGALEEATARLAPIEHVLSV